MGSAWDLYARSRLCVTAIVLQTPLCKVWLQRTNGLLSGTYSVLRTVLPGFGRCCTALLRLYYGRNTVNQALQGSSDARIGLDEWT